MRPSTLTDHDVDSLLRLDVDTYRAPVIRTMLAMVGGRPTERVTLDDEVKATALRRSCRRSAVSGLLLRAVEEDRVSLPPAVVTALRADVDRVATDTLAIDAVALRTASLAEEEGVDITFLKGVATRRLDHPSAADRAYLDVDVLIRGADHGRFVMALIDAGDTVDVRGPADGPTFFKGTELHTQGGIGLDLHTRLFRQSDPSTDGWRPERTSFGIGNRTLHALDAPWRLVHAAGHLVYTPIDERKYNAVVDVVRLVEEGTDLETTMAAARRLGVQAAVAWGISLAISASGTGAELTPDEFDLLDRYATAGDLRSRATRSAFLGRRRRLGREQAAHMMGLRRRDRPRLAWAFLFPSAEYRAHWKAQGRGNRLTYLGRKLMGRR
jgi:putative nucleotidyltransferase-like protein